MASKAKRRGELPSGNVRIQVYVGKDSAGKRIYKSFTAPTRTEAKEAARIWKNTRPEEAPKQAQTVSDAIEVFLDTCRATGLSPSTLLGYRRISKRAYSTLKTVSVDALTLDMIQQYVNAQALRGLSAKSLRNELSLLSCALRNARPDLNFRQIRLPRGTRKEMQIPSNEQIAQLLEASKDTPLYIPILLASMCGLRRSEICALSWKDVDLKKRTIHIHAAEVKDEGGSFTVKGTKTAAGDRIISIPAKVSQELAKNRILSKRVTDLTPDAITRRYERLLDRLAGEDHPRIPGRFHDLRHYHASVMIAVGAPDKYISADMGHASMEMVRRVYGHVMTDRQLTINEQMETHANSILSQIQHEVQHGTK